MEIDMHEQIPLFTLEETPKPKKKGKKQKPPALLDGKVYHQFPKPPDHKNVQSVDPSAEYWWTAEDWDLHMNLKHPNIVYSDAKIERFQNRGRQQ